MNHLPTHSDRNNFEENVCPKEIWDERINGKMENFTNEKEEERMRKHFNIPLFLTNKEQHEKWEKACWDTGRLSNNYPNNWKALSYNICREYAILCREDWLKENPPTELDIMYDILEDIKEKEDGSFKMKNQKIMLTYKTHLPKQEFIEWLSNKVKGQCKIKWIRCAHESGDRKNNYLHTHVLVDFGKQYQCESCRFFDYEGIHPHIKKVKNMKHWRDSQRYLAKEDPENKDLNDIKSTLVEEIWSFETLTDALSQAQRPCDVSGIKLLYDLKKKSEGWMSVKESCIKDIEDMYPWQKQMFLYTVKEPDNRKLFWIADPDGNNGKNEIQNFLVSSHPEKYCWINCEGTVNDIMHVFCKEINNGWRGNTIFINLAKSATSRSEMGQVYKLIENIKDGRISTTKYDGFKVEGNPNFHVIIMSNTYPNVTSLIMDRWEIYVIKSKMLIYVDPNSLLKGKDEMLSL